MNKDELKSILEQHWLWVRGNGGNGGKRANLRDADLRNADLPCANLRDADLKDADLKDADLPFANLRGADLKGADLRDANLKGADLKGADLRDADLRGANLRGADLRGANLRGANLDYSFLPLWCGSKGTIVDRRIAAQIAAHFCALVCDDEDYQAARTAILEFAKTSHRAMDLGLLGETVKECNDVATPIEVALRKRIAELEVKIDQLTAHSDIKRQDDKSSNDTQTQTIVYGKEDSEVQE